MKQLSVLELASWLADTARPHPQVVDVREPWDLETASIAGVMHIPMQEVPARVGELDQSREIVAMCHHGGRSMQVAMFLEQRGFTTYNLAGGIEAWAREVDNTVPRY